MAFKKGDPKPAGSGRKKGQLNRKNLLKVAEVFLDQGIEPVKAILALMPECKPEKRMDAWLELLSYCESKPKDPGESSDGESVHVPAFLIPHLLKSASGGGDG